MFKIAIVGCENSHANGFLDVIRDEKLDVQVLGVHSPFEGAAEKLAEKYAFTEWEKLDSERIATRFVTNVTTKREDVDALLADIEKAFA